MPPLIAACSLPKDIWVGIFSYLSTSELIKIEHVCKYWKKCAEANALWKIKFKKQVPNALELYSHVNYKVLLKKYVTLTKDRIYTHGFCQLEIRGTVFFGTNNKRLVCATDLISHKMLWKREIPAEIGAQEHVLLAIGDKFVAVMMRQGKKIQLLNAKNGEFLKTLEDRTEAGRFTALAAQGPLIACGCTYGKIKLWTKQGTCSVPFDFTAEDIQQLMIRQGKLFALDVKGTLAVWDMHMQKKEVYRPKLESSFLTSFDYHDDKFLCGFSRGNVRLFDADFKKSTILARGEDCAPRKKVLLNETYVLSYSSAVPLYPQNVRSNSLRMIRVRLQKMNGSFLYSEQFPKTRYFEGGVAMQDHVILLGNPKILNAVDVVSAHDIWKKKN
jgi:hypothetical protein